MLLYPLMAALVANVAPALEEENGLNFRVRGTMLVKGGPGDGRIVRVEWRRTPRASDFPEINQRELVHEATFRALCQPAPDGGLKDCEVVAERPVSPELRVIFGKALDLLVMQPSSAKQVEGTASISVSLLMSNPGGTRSDMRYCGPPFCSIVPPPPPPPPPSSERG